MRILITLALATLLAACASVPAETYPSWLHMEEGYAQGCVDDGGCIPMSRRELQDLVNVSAQRGLQACLRGRT